MDKADLFLADLLMLVYNVLRPAEGDDSVTPG